MSRSPLLQVCLVCLASMVGLAALPLSVLTSAAPVPGWPVLVVAGPGNGGPLAVIRRAGLRDIGVEGAPLGRFAVLDSHDQVARLRDAGAWFVLDGRMIESLCGGRG